MPGAGKTTLGKKLALKSGLDFIDTDEFIESKYRMSISTIFSKFGEKGFREIEKTVLNEILTKDSFILATGGGTPCFFDNMEKINNAGISIYLKMPSGAIANRLSNSKKKRPLVAGKSDEQVLEYVETTLTKREQFYKNAKYSIDTIDADINVIFEQIWNFNISH